MNSLEEYSKDWKQIKSRQGSVDINLTKIKNKKIMNKIIQFEKKERRENKWGLILGFGGMLLGCLFGVALPIYLTSLNFNFSIAVGISLMLSGILFFVYIARNEKIDLEKLNENSRSYLLAVKQKLQSSGSRKNWHGIGYVAFIISGMLCIYWGVFSQISDGESFFYYNFWMPVLFGILGWMFWRIRYTKKEKIKITPLLEEIDQILASID